METEIRLRFEISNAETGQIERLVETGYELIEDAMSRGLSLLCAYYKIGMCECYDKNGKKAADSLSWIGAWKKGHKAHLLIEDRRGNVWEACENDFDYVSMLGNIAYKGHPNAHPAHLKH